MEEIVNYINTYSEDHHFRELLKNIVHPFPKSYLSFFAQSIKKINDVSERAAKDFLNNKIRAKSGNSFNYHGLLSSLCELTILNTLVQCIDSKETFKYEPKQVNGSQKNPEFSLVISGVRYFIEVKTPNLENHKKKINKLVEEKGAVQIFDSRFMDLTNEQKKLCVTSTDSKVKDFLVDTNKKFSKSDKITQINVLFICWTDENDQPATALKYPTHGLLTKNSWFKDEQGQVITFKNIDLIFVNDLYRNHEVHMACIDHPMPSLMSGVPYFDKIIPYGIPNPFNLGYSRNAIIETEIDPKIFFSLPICFSDDYVQVINEGFVAKYCPEVKFTFK